MRGTLLLVAAAAVGLSSCRSNNLLLGEVEAQVGTHKVRVTDCYRWSVPPPERLADANGKPAWRFMPCRDADVRITAGRLTVNGQDYGPIAENDGVLVDHGRVSILAPDVRARGK
jgi:hypothetical protein